MIRLVSSPTAAALVRLAKCKERIAQAEAASEEPPESAAKCYRHREVKDSILTETAGKCAYCEAKMTHVDWGDVEHIRPQEHFPELSLDYDNLTLSCAICNNNKSSYYNEKAPIIDPYTGDPGDHLVGIGALIWHRHGSKVGQRTVTLFQLNREGLNEQRWEHLQLLSGLADRFMVEPEGPIKEVLANEMRVLIADTAEFTLAARSFLTAYGLVPGEI